MSLQLEPASHGHWLNWDFYSEYPIKADEQVKYLNSIREYIVKHIRKEGKKEHLYLLDLHLYPDATNDKIYKLIGNLSSMPNRNISKADLKHDHDFYTSGGETSLVVTGVPPPKPKGNDLTPNAGGGETSLVVTGVPPPKPKGTDLIPFIRILADLAEGPRSSALINMGPLL
jgi:hypothetical protein